MSSAVRALTGPRPHHPEVPRGGCCLGERIADLSRTPVVSTGNPCGHSVRRETGDIRLKGCGFPHRVENSVHN